MPDRIFINDYFDGPLSYRDQNPHIRSGCHVPGMTPDRSLGGYVVSIVRSHPTEEIVELYREGNWWKEGHDPAGVPGLIEGSFRFAVAVPEGGGKAAGMGRAISDGVSDAYIQDVVVRKELRKLGIGRAIVELLLAELEEAGIGWIGLIAEEGSYDFYRELGFQRFTGTPMLYRKEG